MFSSTLPYACYATLCSVYYFSHIHVDFNLVCKAGYTISGEQDFFRYSQPFLSVKFGICLLFNRTRKLCVFVCGLNWLRRQSVAVEGKGWIAQMIQAEKENEPQISSLKNMLAIC